MPAQTQPPVNLILCGPPGPGKTYATVEGAVRLCCEVVPEDHAVPLAVYQRLVDEGPIAFVTFHQAMFYEEFVKGLRPDTSSDDAATHNAPPGAGFGCAWRTRSSNNCRSGQWTVVARLARTCSHSRHATS